MNPRTICALIAASTTLSASAQDESFRFFFDTKGASEVAVRPAGSLSFTNPTVTGAGRLYLYLQYGTNNQAFVGNNLIVDVTGAGRITGGAVYNIPIEAPSSTNRWNATGNQFYGDGIGDNFDLPTRWTMGSVFAAPAYAGFGAVNVPNRGHPAPELVDKHYSGFVGGDGSTFGTTLLGFVDVASTGPGTGEVRLLNGSSGDAGETVSNLDFVYFGFGDAAVLNKKGAFNGGVGGPTPVADAFITPEPISLALMGGIAVIGLRGRRQRAA